MNALAHFGAQQPPREPAALAREILSQSRFRMRVHAPAARTWWDALRDWLADRWHQLVDAFSRHVHVSASASAALGDLLIGAIVLVIVVTAARLLLGIAREGSAAASGAADLPGRPDAVHLHAAALGAADNGRYAAAIALLFRAALAVLDARGVLRDDPARTVNECRRDVRARASRLSAPFETIARAFTAAVYAEERVTVEAWNGAQIAYAAFAESGQRAA